MQWRVTGQQQHIASSEAGIFPKVLQAVRGTLNWCNRSKAVILMASLQDNPGKPMPESQNILSLLQQ